MELDRADRAILRALQGDCTLGAEALGERCGLSPSTALRRVRRLRSAGVITGEIALVDPKKVGLPLLVIVGVRLERDDARIAGDFVREMQACPAVVQCYFVTGTIDYSLIVAASDMEAFDDFVQTKLVANPHVTMTESHVVIRPVKTGMTLPIPN